MARLPEHQYRARSEMCGEMDDQLGRQPCNWAAFSRVLSWLVIATLGAIEGLYGRTEYLGDAISYLNVSRAVSIFDWKGIFNPMWTPGYPMLVALMRAAFPRTPEGEWYAITLLNWLIFLLAYASWRYLIRQCIEFYQPTSLGLQNHPIAVWITCCVFLWGALCLNNVSSAYPDLLVTTLFILIAAQILSLLNRTTVTSAVILGLTLGIGCWTKGVFLSFSLIFLFTIFLACQKKRIPWRMLGIATFVYLLVYAPFVAGTSWSYGEFTLGTSGSLNYAFHVNHLPHWTNWQGGPPEFGAPIHATRQMLKDLPVFEFGSPFQTTYPPYNNMTYWYQGFHHFYRLKLQLIALARTLYFFAALVKANPFLWVLALVLFVMVLNREWRVSLREMVRRFWPLFLPVYLGVATYMLVHVEDRYLSPFCLILGLAPLLPLLNAALPSKRALAVFLMLAYASGAGAELKTIDGPTFRAAMQRYNFHNDPQWKLAAALPYGLQSDDAVAVIQAGNPSYRCHWAYISHLRIVAEFGALPWTLEPWDRTRFDHTVEPADQNYGNVFWNKLTPQQREQVIDAFRKTGARAILSLSRPNYPPEGGWQPVDGTHAMIYRFDR